MVSLRCCCKSFRVTDFADPTAEVLWNHILPKKGEGWGEAEVEEVKKVEEVKEQGVGPRISPLQSREWKKQIPHLVRDDTWRGKGERGVGGRLRGFLRSSLRDSGQAGWAGQA
jgi:hypothetical protein